MLAIYKRELRSYFNSLTGWLFCAVLLAFEGVYFMVYNLMNGYTYFSYALGSSLFIFMIIVPVLTMRSFAGERHARTDQLLLTAPVSIAKVVLGKFFAMVSVFAAPCLLSCLCPLIIAMNGTAQFAADYASILAFFLLGCVYIAVGLFLSSLTENQIVAAVSTFGALLLLYLWDDLVTFLPTTAKGSLIGFLVLLAIIAYLTDALSRNWKMTAAVIGAGLVLVFGFYLADSAAFTNLLPTVLGRFSLQTAFGNFCYDHIFDLGGIVLYVSLSALFVFLTAQVIQRRRWN